MYLQDTLNPDLCTQDCEMLYWVSPVYFAVFVLSTQFVLVNVVVAVLMKQLEDSKDSSVSSDEDCISDMDESFSNGHKSGQSVDDEFETSINYATEVRDICLNVHEEVDKNSNTETENVFKEADLECEIPGTDEANVRQYESASKQLQLQDAQGSLDKSSVNGEYGLENAIIVVSPAQGHGYENAYIPRMSNCDEDYRECTREVKSGSFLSIETEDNRPEISYCRSMPELSASERTDCHRSLVRSKESRSDPQTMSCSREETAKSSYKKCSLDRPFLGRKRSRSKVAPLARGLTIPSHDFSVYEDIKPPSVSSTIDS